MEEYSSSLAGLLGEHYHLHPTAFQRAGLGAGSDTWFVTCTEGKYVVKFPSVSTMNHPGLEPAVCRYLLDRGIPVCQFLPNRNGDFLSQDEMGRVFHVQRFIEGQVFDLHAAPPWLMDASATLLGRIHRALGEYPGLPEGIGAGFFQYMTPENALASYERTLDTALGRGDEDIAADLRWRMGLMERFSAAPIQLEKLTRVNTHGDFFVSQLLCGEAQINAVIDWTTACVHPAVWEVFRSFVYGEPACAGAGVDAERLTAYVRRYLDVAPLNGYDLEVMPRLYFYQIAVCDYYNQYYSAQTANRDIYLWQARYATKLMGGLEPELNHLSDVLTALT